MDAYLPRLDRIEPDGDGQLRPVAAGIWATPDEPLGGPANTCGFLLQRPGGNAFIYSCNAIDQYYRHLDELGGVSMILLNHRDEATRHVTTLADRYRIPVHTHRLEVDACKANGVREIEPFSTDKSFGPDLEAMPTPGHTAGTTSYLWHNPADDRRYLFTGDTFTNFTIDNFPAVLGFHPYGSNTVDATSSLARIRATPSDTLVPGLANGTIHAYRWTTEQRHELVDHALAQITTA